MLVGLYLNIYIYKEIYGAPEALKTEIILSCIILCEQVIFRCEQVIMLYFLSCNIILCEQVINLFAHDYAWSNNFSFQDFGGSIISNFNTL